MAEFRNQTTEIAQTKPAVSIGIFIPARQRRAVARRDPQHAITKNPLRIDTVLKNLPDRPSIGCMYFVNLLRTQMAR